MKHCLLFALALLLTAPAAFAQPARIAELKADAARMAEQHAQPVSPVVVRGGETIALDRFYGHFNLIDQNPATNGFGYADVNDPSFDFVKLYDYPVPTTENLPLGGSFGPDGRFYMVSNVGSVWGFYAFDISNPQAGYTEIAFPITGSLVFGADEVPVGLAYDPTTETMTMATIYCDLDDEGNYRQSLLYSIDVNTGLATYLRDLEDAAASPEGPYFGVCLISFTWDGGDQIFGVDIVEDDLLQINAATGQLVERYDDPFILDVNFVQHSAYNYNDGIHYLLPFSRQTDTGPYFGSVHACTVDDGCALVGFINDNVPPVEQITAAFVWDGFPGVSAEAGATTTSVSLNVYPNPVADQARVALALERAQAVEVAVYDLLGRRVATLHSGVTDAVDVTLAGRQLPSGVYFVTARGESFQTTQKIVVAH